MVLRRQGGSARISWTVITAAGIALAALGAWLVLIWSPPLSDDPPPAATRTAPVPATAAADPQGAPVTATRIPGLPSLVVIGDSFTTGTSDEVTGTWPDLVCQRVGCQYLPQFAVQRTGYTVPGADGRTVSGRLRSVIDARPDLVVVATGAFDSRAPRAALIGSVNETLYRLQRKLPSTRIIVLSPFWPAAPAPPRVIEVRGWIYDASVKHKVGFVNVTDLFDEAHPDLMETNATAPNQRGQQYVADIVEPFVRSATP